MAKHTKTPWHFLAAPKGKRAIIANEDVGTRIADVGDASMSVREVNGNAALIAAAPDLLHACLAVRTAVRVGRNPTKSQADAKAAMDEALPLVMAALTKAGHK